MQAPITSSSSTFNSITSYVAICSVNATLLRERDAWQTKAQISELDVIGKEMLIDKLQTQAQELLAQNKDLELRQQALNLEAVCG